MTFAIVFSGLLGIGIAAALALVVRYLGVARQDSVSLFLLAALAAMLSVVLLLFTT